MKTAHIAALVLCASLNSLAPIHAQSISCGIWNNLADQANARFDKLPIPADSWQIDLHNLAWSKCFVNPGVWVGCDLSTAGNPSLRAETLISEIEACFPNAAMTPREDLGRYSGEEQRITIPKRAQFSLHWGGQDRPNSVQWIMLNEIGVHRTAAETRA